VGSTLRPSDARRVFGKVAINCFRMPIDRALEDLPGSA
jgi:hypothetical protein